MGQRRPAVVLTVLGAAAVAGGLVLLAQRGSLGSRQWPVMAAIGGLAVILLAIVLITKVRRGRPASPRTSAGSAAERLGLQYRAKAEAKYHARFAPLPSIPTGGDVRHLLSGPWDGRALTIFQHAYQVHTGQAPIPVYHTVYITDAPPWPHLTVTRRNLLGRILFRLGRRPGLLLDEDDFNAAMKVTTDDEDFALILLGPDLQRFLVAKPSVAWSIQPGRVAMIYPGSLRPDRIDASLERLMAFWELVPADLEAWQ